MLERIEEMPVDNFEEKDRTIETKTGCYWGGNNYSLVQPSRINNIVFDQECHEPVLKKYIDNSYDNLFISFTEPMVAFDEKNRKREFYLAEGEAFANGDKYSRARLLFSNILSPTKIYYEGTTGDIHGAVLDPSEEKEDSWVIKKFGRPCWNNDYFLVAINSKYFSSSKDPKIIMDFYRHVKHVLEIKNRKNKINNLRDKISSFFRPESVDQVKQVSVGPITDSICEGIYKDNFYEEIRKL